MDSAARPSSTSSADTSVPEDPDDSKSREGTPSSDPGGYLPGGPCVTPVELTGSATGAGVTPGASWRVGYEHPLTAATSAMLNIQTPLEDQQHHHQQHQVVLYDEYDFRSGSVVPAAHGSIIPHLNKVSDDPQHLGSNSELSLLLTSGAGTSLVKREAEDLTASRRSPGLAEGRRLTVSTVVGLDDRVGSPGSGGGRGFPTSQQPVAVLHPEDSPSPKDMSSAAHYTAQYTGLAPAQVFPDVVATQYSVMPHSPTSSINYTSVSLGGPASQPLRLAGNGASLVASAGGGGVYATVDPYYRDYYSPPVEQYTTTAIGSTARPTPVYGDSQEPQHGQFVERYIRTSTAPGGYKLPGHGLTVDLPSPDSGIGAEATTPRDQNPAALQQTPAHGYEYTDLCGQGGLIPTDPSLLRPQSTTPNSVTRSRPWHDFGRQTEVDKIHIPKIYSNYGFRFFMESPISTSQRREDDRMTYVNKGQFYGVTMEYVPDPDRPLKSGTVKSVVLLLFREEKVLEDEMKAWQFWHSRQHSVKQRILDVDTKNSIGLVGGIDEISHNAIAVYWNPLESSAKISIAVQCLSTDFSSQKGVKGLPLHIQIDTYEDYRDPNCPVSHRAYVQVKSFCDKGAERKTRDEERRASKRKMTVTGRKKMEEMYHPSSERSELYSMADTTKPPMLFQPSDEEPEKQLGTMELQNYYGQTDNDHQMCADTDHSPVPSQMASPGETAPPDSGIPVAPLKFHYSFPTAAVPGVDPTALEGGKDGDLLYSAAKRARLSPPANQRVMLYVRQEQEELYTPLHMVPPTTLGLLHAISNKYKITSSCVQTLCRKNRKGVTAIVDDDMIQHYCNEDTFLLEIRQLEPDGPYDITLIEVGD